MAMADKEQLGLPSPQMEILSGDMSSSDQIDASPCDVSPLDIKKKKPRRGRRHKPKIQADGIPGDLSSADNLFSLATVSQIDVAFAQLCVDPQSGDVSIPPEFDTPDNEASCDGPKPDLDPGGKIVKKRKPRTKKKSWKVVNENTVPSAPLNDDRELPESVIPNLLGRPVVLNSASQGLGLGLLNSFLDGISESASTVGLPANEGASHSPLAQVLPQCSVIPTPTFESNPSQKKNKRASNHKNALSPHPLLSNEAGLSPRSPNVGNKTPRSNGGRRSFQHAKEELFNNYLPESVVRVGLEGKRFVEGQIRINPKSYTEAYIADPEKGQDILIEGMKNRNRALEGDEVVVVVHPQSEWKKQAGPELQKTASVVFIRTQIHPRVAVGLLKPMPDRNPDVAIFSPRDSRVPRIRVPISTCPAGFLAEHKKYEKVLFLASIIDWSDTRFAIGVVLEAMGPLGDLKAENTAILLENDLTTDPYTPEMYSYFPSASYTVTAADMAGREDLRAACVFTIDPATARDLDDAVSARDLPNSNVEVGVHISDVSHFVGEGTPFDREVADRATSTYLVDTVYHMLPRELCMLCSLLPGVDKLAYSVFWEMDRLGNVVSHRFTRSVINSCAQLSYEHAQEMVENADKRWTSDELPEIHNGFTVHDLSRTVNLLHSLAAQLRGRRFESGALRIDQPKLNFSLDHATGRPIGFSCYVNKESHRLIEEFMLLANMTVAKRIYADFPQCAFLRSHLSPHPYLMDQLRAMMESYGIHLDTSSAGALQKTMKKYDGDDFPSQARMMVLYARCSKPMARAKYFCTNGVDEEDFFHYALNVPLYTHFTSPIRRYPDIMVHRLLSASLGYSQPPNWIPDDVQKIASNCNKKKFAAKRAGEQSTEIYLSLYVGQLGEMLESAVVIDVKDRSFDVIVCSMGINQRVYTNKLSAEVKHVHRDNTSVLEITWLPTLDVPHTTVQTIEMFAIVTVLVTKAPDVLRVQSELKRPSVSGNTFSLVKI